MQRGIFIDNNAKTWLSLLEALKDMKPLPEELTEKVNDLIMSINDYVYGDFYDYFKEYNIDDITYKKSLRIQNQMFKHKAESSNGSALCELFVHFVSSEKLI